MRPPDGRLPCPGFIVEYTGAQDRPLERVALHEVLVCLVLPLHIHGDGAADASRHRFVFLRLMIHSQL